MISIINHENNANNNNIVFMYVCIYVHNYFYYKNRCVAEYIIIIYNHVIQVRFRCLSLFPNDESSRSKY